MLLAPKEEAIARRREIILNTGRASAYAGAMSYARHAGLIADYAGENDPVVSLPEELFSPTEDYSRAAVYSAFKFE